MKYYINPFTLTSNYNFLDPDSCLAPRLDIGDIVMSKSLNWPWQTHFLANPNDLEKVPEACLSNLPITFSCLGLIGLTVLLGIRQKGGLQNFTPSSDETGKK